MNKYLELMKQFSFPEDALQYFLDQEIAAEFESQEYYDIQNICLFPFSEIKTTEIGLSTWEYRVNHAIKDDPNIGSDGYYWIEMLDLIREVNDYECDGLLVWIPEIKQFGTCDCDHGVIYIFKDIGWTEILENLFTYVNTQWIYNGEIAKSLKKQYQIFDIYDYCNPWEIWTFNED